MDTKDIVEKVVLKVLKDKSFGKELKSDPAKALEQLTGLDLPNDQVNSIVKSVAGKVSLDSVGGLLDSDGDGKADLGGLSKLGDLLKK